MLSGGELDKKCYKDLFLTSVVSIAPITGSGDHAVGLAVMNSTYRQYGGMSNNKGSCQRTDEYLRHRARLTCRVFSPGAKNQVVMFQLKLF